MGLNIEFTQEIYFSFFLKQIVIEILYCIVLAILIHHHLTIPKNKLNFWYTPLLEVNQASKSLVVFEWLSFMWSNQGSACLKYMVL